MHSLKFLILLFFMIQFFANNAYSQQCDSCNQLRTEVTACNGKLTITDLIIDGKSLLVLNLFDLNYFFFLKKKKLIKFFFFFFFLKKKKLIILFFLIFFF